jgi:hypothetical protein
MVHRIAILFACGLLACGGKAVIDGPGGAAGADAASEPCPGFTRWCDDYAIGCNGAALCNPSICTAAGGPQALACIAALPSDASCDEMAACGGA